MMEEPNPVCHHYNPMPVASFDDLIIPKGASTLNDVPNPTLLSPVNIVPEGEECITGQADPLHTFQIQALLFWSKRFGLLHEKPFPPLVVVQFVAQIRLHRIVLGITAELRQKWQGEDPLMLPQVPEVSLLPCKPGAVDS